MVSLDLFEGASGILGASGPSLSCRNQSAWGQLLRDQQVLNFTLDFTLPPSVAQDQVGIDDRGDSRVVLNWADPPFMKNILWSQPKQTGDATNDGMPELLIYHPTLCGVDMLYNTSSNWLTVIDTSGPCLALPPFLYDRFMTRLPVDCPTPPGHPAFGALCSPKRTFNGKKASGATLPALYFSLQDDQDPMPPTLALPLERLVFKNSSGHELICIARADGDQWDKTADMTLSHIALGSLAASALYTVVDLKSNKIGFAPRTKDLSIEATTDYCSADISCISPMQSYFPPLNICEDPLCGEYMLMVLDEETKMCVWSKPVPAAFIALLFAVAILDFWSHRMYKQALDRASEQYCQ